MTTITVSEDTALRFHHIAASSGKDPEALLIEFLNQQEEEAILAQPLTPEEIAAVERAIAEGESGLGIPFETYVVEKQKAREARREARLAGGEGQNNIPVPD